MESLPIWKPGAQVNTNLTTSFIKKGNLQPVQSQTGPSQETALPSDHTSIVFNAPQARVLEAPVNEAVIQPQIPAKPYQAPEGLSGPLLLTDEMPIFSGGGNGTTSATRQNTGLTSFEAADMGFGAGQAVEQDTAPKVPSFVLSGVLGSLSSSGGYTTSEMLASLGVKPNQKTGQDFDANLTGEAQKTQRLEWQAGQVADLISHGRDDWAQQVVNGSHGNLAGKNLYAELLQREQDDKAFADHWRGNSWVVTQDVTERHPDKLDGKMVVFRQLNEQGEVEEHRGRLVFEGDAGSAMFRLKGSDHEFNSNNIRELAYPPSTQAEERLLHRPDNHQVRSERPVRLPTTPAGSPPSTFLYSLSKQTAGVAMELLSQYGVHANQATGEAFNPALTGAEKKEQYQSWQLGQVADLISKGRKDLADDVISGRHSELAGQNVYEKVTARENAEIAFNADFRRQGWALKSDPRSDMAPDTVNGSMVSFLHQDEKGETHQVSGILRQAKRESGSALFTVDGHEGQFNSNEIKAMAVKPGSSFADRFKTAGWSVKDDRFSPSPQEMQGKTVAFMVEDGPGNWVQRQGVLRAGEEGSAVFTLDGQQGTFNNNYIHELAVKKSPFDVGGHRVPSGGGSLWDSIVGFFSRF